MKKLTTIDGYINTYPQDVQEKLHTLKKLIQEELPPETKETISYGVPTFKLNESYVVYFAAYKSHISIYPINFDIEETLPEMASYRKGRGTAQFPLNKPLPYPLIRKVVGLLLEKNLERSGKSNQP